MRGRAAALAGVLCLAALLFAGEDAMRPRVRDPATRDGLRRADAGCIGCHGGVEVMHPWKALSCTECHGGDGGATTRDRAHVRSSLPVPNDERTPPLNYDLNYRRFANPADLRVINKTCGTCHAEECVALRKSLHGTTAGHLSDGLYENGVIRSRTRRFSMFSVRDEDGTVPEHAYSSMPQIPAPTFARKDDIGSHFADLPRKSCMQCHLYSRGLGVRGRLGQDGWYRGEGCAACHVTYGRDGLSHSADASLDKLEPGHPLRHQMTTKIPTETCTRCHALDANIGMSFRGLGQLPPGVPGGPDVPGTTNVLSKGRFFINDPAICPADVHRERGMHCIDCHNSTDVMGDGNIWGVMEHAVGVECSTCHGTFTQKATFETSRGEKLDHLKWEAGEAVLTGRVTGRKHVVKQVKDVLDRRSRHYNPRAARAMTGDHARLTCYACHSAWSVNFFGFHFDRNESFDQLDIIAGRRTPGRVSTQEKIFATFRHYYLGWDSAGRIAPYMVGFSTAGTYRDKSGDVVLRQEFPRTAAGLSGMTMIHHQVHTVQPVARRCAECHSAPSVLGMGSQNFHLFRDLFITVGDAGLTVCGFDVKNPAQSRGLVNLPLPSRPLDVALLNDSISGRARYAYVPLANGTVRVVDVSDPVSPRLGVKLDVQGAEAVLVREGMLFVAAGEQGLQLYSLDAPKRPRHVARVRTQNAHRVFVDGLYAYVADGRGGLRIVDLTIPHKPAVVATVDLNGSDSAPLDTRAVLVHYTPARPVVKEKRRTVGRNIAYVADARLGLVRVDVSDPRAPKVMRRTGVARGGGFAITDMAFASNYDIGSVGGDIPSAERDYLYLVGTQTANGNGLIIKVDVSGPVPAVAGTRRTVNDPRGVRVARVFQPPFLKQYAIVVGRGRGDVELVDVTGRGQLPQVGVVPGVGPCVGLDYEYMPLDRLIGFDGKPLKDVSHEGARLFTREEISRILTAEVR